MNPMHRESLFIPFALVFLLVPVVAEPLLPYTDQGLNSTLFGQMFTEAHNQTNTTFSDANTSLQPHPESPPLVIVSNASLPLHLTRKEGQKMKQSIIFSSLPVSLTARTFLFLLPEASSISYLSPSGDSFPYLKLFGGFGVDFPLVPGVEYIITFNESVDTVVNIP